MLLSLKPTSIGLRISANIPNDRAAFAGGQQLTLAVHLEGRDHLDLETGEVFQNPAYAKIRSSKEALVGSFSIAQAREPEDFGFNQMRYIEGVKTDDGDIGPQIHFRLYLPSDDFQQLIANARSGLLPSSISIDLAHNIFDRSSPVEYGWEPDGSGKKWNNRASENRSIKIEGATFTFELLRHLGDRSPEEIAQSEPLSPAESMQAHTAIVNATLLSILSGIRNLGIAVAVIGGAILLVLWLKG